jgi:hypothetical protein
MTEKTNFDDLTNYTHQIAPFVLDGVKNVGWIDPSKEFPVGSVSSATVQKLKEIASGTGIFQPLVEPLREPPICQVCGSLNLLDLDGKSLPNAELWIPSDRCIYASPIAILHFIEFHKYSPPEEYLAAIEALNLSVAFSADSIYRDKLLESGWFNRVK